VVPTDIVEITDEMIIAPFDMVLMEGELYIQDKQGGEVKYIQSIDTES
jgi:hypothetical protein